MKILFLHGWQSVPGGVKPTYLKDHGHAVINPKLPDEDWNEAVRIAQAEFDQHQPDVVIGSSRGGAVAMNINSGDARLVLLCPAWKKWGTARTIKADTYVLHSRADDVVPFVDSEELVRNSGATLIEVGNDHRLADPVPLEAMLRACHNEEPVERVPTFGIRDEGATYTNRNAVYAVILGEADTVAVVQGPSGCHWLPGGGSLPAESNEDTITREIREELARDIRLLNKIGEAIQFFHVPDEDRHYRMRATFFRAELGFELTTIAEHELCWLPFYEASTAFFHECHSWAVNEAIQRFNK